MASGGCLRGNLPHVTPDQFLNRCRSLWHVAPPGAWPSVAQLGLRTAEQLIHTADVDEDARATLRTQPRLEPARFTVDGHEVTLRDQRPLFARKDLESVLADDLAVADWICLLNRRVYLFANRVPMQRLLEKYVALDGAQDVFTFSPLRLLDAVGHRLELAAHNSGAVARRNDHLNGVEAFLPVRRFPDRVPAEVTIVDGIDDLSVIIRAERHYADGRREILAR